jgi:hypothetical protein
VFIDELVPLGVVPIGEQRQSRRTGTDPDQLLVEMDGFDRPRD